MRYFSILLTLAVAGCVSDGTGKPEVIASTPASIELATWCSGPMGDDPVCRQAAADAAQAHCRAGGQNAQYQRSALVQRDALLMNARVDFSYICVH